MSQTHVSTIAVEHPTSQRVRRLVWIAFAGAVLSLMLTACGDDAAVATDQNLPLDVTPAALADVPQGVSEAYLIVKDGKFEQTELILAQDQPTQLYIQNHDNTEYQFEIVNGLVDKSGVGANLETIVGFTTPRDGFYEAHLLTGDGLSLKAKLFVVVQSAGGETP